MKKIIAFVLLISLNIFANDIDRADEAYDKQDYKTAIEYYTKATNSQDLATKLDAMNQLGFIYDNVEIHQGITPNLKLAYEWYKKCADLDDAQCQFNIGSMYDEGHGVIQNYAEAMFWYKKAAEKDFVDAFYNIGLIYEIGKGTRKDIQEAIKWYSKAAALGDVESAQIVNELKATLK
ncbi:sel1 repeat family protein [Arcobacter lanthieri]|uniref:tetratricopeptide repeat protein n=1 Tax=Aliarcobacter lanthieri TaxID=1355374 RepID=UPI0019212B68|nr:tetratricopeptide repeat protein [Aliarcobacter lanthieri]MBL3519998.1 sel1 repeat family protein [Aliarcobacter lanthieri]